MTTALLRERSHTEREYGRDQGTRRGVGRFSSHTYVVELRHAPATTGMCIEISQGGDLA